ncbi:MAG TPA: RnfABCDGE type electron transport complex subunit D [Clostridiales bacterium]|nr:RnfABCDGE type electron transport complex subunit D [Clostridiales bacterium]
MNSNTYLESSSPHIHQGISTKSIMRDVIIALLPALVASIIVFKIRALIIVVLSVVSCVLGELLWQKTFKQKVTIDDLSAVVTGILLAFSLPPSVPYYIPVIGGIFAIIIVKQIFGGIGKNFLNPALASRAFLMATWPAVMTKWTLDGISTATPLELLNNASPNLPSLWEVFIGYTGGSIGETSALALIIGGIYLLYRNVITWEIPVSYIGSVFLLSFLFCNTGTPFIFALYEIFAGGLLLGAIYMATDYTTSPVTKKGKFIMGIGCGVLTFLFRTIGQTAEGVCYSILIMNLFVPMIERHTIPRTFGEVK